MPIKTQPTTEDPYSGPEDSKAEITQEEFLQTSLTDSLSSRVVRKIFASLCHHAQCIGGGQAYRGHAEFVVDLPNRKSFKPDIAFYVGSSSVDGKLLQGASIFAVEVRKKEGDASAELEMEAKRKDYFAAGTGVVWDVDMIKAKVVRVYRAEDPDNPVIYRSDEIAEAEPALPGWTLSVDDLLTDDRALWEEAESAYSEDGVDLTLIRWMLSMTPAERLQTLQQFVESVMRLRNGKFDL